MGGALFPPCYLNVHVKLLSRVRLRATPIDGRLPGSSVHGIFQARVLEWGAIAFSEMMLGEYYIKIVD